MTTPESAASPRAKADLTKRFLAALIDGLLVGGVSMIPVLGGIAGAAYMLVRDGLELEFMDRRSIGKKLLKLRPERLDGQPMDVATSVKRNITLCIGAIGSIFFYVPVLGLVVAPIIWVVGLALGLAELFLVLTDAEGRRLGDKYAGTKVIETAD